MDRLLGGLIVRWLDVQLDSWTGGQAGGRVGGEEVRWTNKQMDSSTDKQTTDIQRHTD